MQLPTRMPILCHASMIRWKPSPDPSDSLRYLLSGYWKVEVAEDDRQKMAFITHEGLFELKVMFLGLCDAPSTFQRLMDPFIY